jgi:putative hydrolases of HD superfamily
LTEQEFGRCMGFLGEIDGLKGVVRQSPLADGSRRENSAEHSWHVAMFALVLGRYVPEANTARVIAMLLLHDLVEIDVGDTPIHLPHDHAAIAEAEGIAATRLFGLLPEPVQDDFLSLWSEFEEGTTPDARLAKAFDRLQPLLINILAGGGTWTYNNVSEPNVYETYGPVIERGSEELWQFARGMVRSYFEGIDAS